MLLFRSKPYSFTLRYNNFCFVFHFCIVVVHSTSGKFTHTVIFISIKVVTDKQSVVRDWAIVAHEIRCLALVLISQSFVGSEVLWWTCLCLTGSVCLDPDVRSWPNSLLLAVAAALFSVFADWLCYHFGWGKSGKVTSVGWQVTLPIWHVSSRSG